MGYKKMSCLQQILYVLIYKLGEFKRNHWKFILCGKSAATKDDTDS